MQLDFNTAILAHIEWKKKFQAHLAGAAKLDPQIVGADHHCELGKWIAGNPALRSVPEYETLRQAHAEFHRQAAEVIRNSANSASPAEAMKLLDLTTPFGKASGRCVKAIADLRDRLQSRVPAKV